MENAEALTLFLNSLLQQINTGFGALEGISESLLGLLVVLNIVIAALFLAFGSEGTAVFLIKRLLTISVIIWIVRTWPALTFEIFQSFLQGGLIAGGSSLNANEVFDVGSVAAQGVDISLTLGEKIESVTGPVGFFTNFFLIAILGFAVITVVVAFFALAVQLFFSLIIFQVGSLLALLLMPFAVFQPTSWIAERPIAWVFSSGLRIASLTLVAGLTQTVFLDLAPDSLADITVQRTFAIILGSVVLAALAILAPRFASDLIGGAPSFGSGAILGAAAGVGAGVGAGVSGAATTVATVARTAAAAPTVAAAGAGLAAAAGRQAVGAGSGSATRGAARNAASTITTSAANITGRGRGGSQVSATRQGAAARRLLSQASASGGGGSSPSIST